MKQTFKDIFYKLYISIFAVSVFALLVLTTPWVYNSNKIEILFWVVLEILADYKSITILRYNRKASVTMGSAVHLCAIIVLGVYKSVWVIIIATVIVEIISRKSLIKILFNAGQYGLCIFAGGFIFHHLKRSPPSTFFGIPDIPAILIASCAYFALNLLFMSVVLCLTSNISFHHFALGEIKSILVYFYTMVPISISMAVIYSHDFPYALLIMFPPILMSDQVLRRYFEIQKETQKTLKLVADIVDKRDNYTFSHSMRVAEYSKKIASRLKLTEDAIYEIEMAGQVHDLGKIAVEDSILRKNGRLTEEEFAQIKRHPEVGYELLKNLKHYNNGPTFILYHHERPDGRGYPKGLTGKNIPLGAKILAVADSYDAMTTNRPYRGALPQSAAVEELKKHSETQFDAEVVKAFINVLKEDYGYEEA